MTIKALFLPGSWARAGSLLRRPEAMAFLPALTLGAFWFGGEATLILTALGVPLAVAVAGGIPAHRDVPTLDNAMDTRDEIVAALDDGMRTDGRTTACLVIRVDEPERLSEIHGRRVQERILHRLAERLPAVLRRGDLVALLGDSTLAVALADMKRLDLETMVQLSARLQTALAPAISLNGMQIHISCSIGFCMASRSPEPGGLALLEAAEIAAEDALRNGPSAIRGFSDGMSRAGAKDEVLRGQLEAALDAGQIKAHFQPQVSTDTGAVTGFEALARWHHPDRGILTPAEFLTAIEDMGLAERLGETMLFNALSALAKWDKAGLAVPTVAVNFSASELSDPKLPEKIKWELDRFDLAPDRLTIEILETVATDTDNDVIVRNVAALAALGCGVDLDDFGAGSASIASLRRFTLRRIKIDRSFVAGVDVDREQQRIVSAILLMSERLGLQSVAEGVESTGEHTMLAQLGCGHVQGFGIGRPMPYESTEDWMRRHNHHLATAPLISHRAG